MTTTKTILLALCAFTTSVQAATLMRLQCAGPAGVDASGNAWQADGYFLGGARWDASNQPAMAAQPVPYRSLRYAASFSYTLPVPSPGDYVVTLKFVEPNKTAVGQRIFSIVVNGKVVAPAFDLFAVAGQASGLKTPSGTLTPYDLTYPATTTTGQIRIDLAAVFGNAMLSAIQIDDVPPPPPPPPPPATDAFLAGHGILFNSDGIGHTTIQLDPMGIGYRPWQSVVFPGPDPSVTILGKDHGIVYAPNCAIAVELWDASDPETIRRITTDVIAEDVVSINRQTCDVTITFKQPRSQYFVVVR